MWSLSVKKTNTGFFAPKPYLKGLDWNFLFDRKFCLSLDIATWKAAWRLEKRIFHNIGKQKNGKKWPKTYQKKQNNLTRSYNSYYKNDIFET